MTTDTKVAELPNVGAAATARRKYHHVLNGGSLTAQDVAGMVEAIERLEAALARKEADKTAASVITLTDAPTAPPAAQAVDLEQFRDCVIEAKESWLQCAENWEGRVRESQYREWVDDCDRLLKLIDQQAGKGVDRA